MNCGTDFDQFRTADDFGNARQCAHVDPVPPPPAPRAPPPGDYTQSHPPRARSFYHSLPARSNSPRQDPSRGSGRLQKRHRGCRRATRHSRSASDPIRGCSVISSGDGLSRCTSGFGPAMREKSSSLPAAARTGLSLRVAPWPRIAKKNSSLAGANTAASTGEEPATSATLTHQSSRCGKIGAGAVDRIDDPDQLLAETGFVINAFFRQPAIIRRRRAQPPLDEVVDGDVGLGDRRRGALGPVLQLGAKQRQRQRAGLAHGVPQQRGIARPDRRRRYQRPPSVRPSMRSVGALTP